MRIKQETKNAVFLKTLLTAFSKKTALPLRHIYWEIACMGQTSTQEPQSTHFAASITYWLSAGEIASTGQLGAQAPQDTHSLLILYAID